MQKLQYYIYTLMAIALLAGCAEDNVTLEPQERDVHFCVRTTWQNGLSDGSATRTLADDLLTGEIGDIIINTDDYPGTIDVVCSDGTDFALTKSTLCNDHPGYMSYTPSVIYKDNKIIRDNLTFSFTAEIDDGDRLESQADKDSLQDAHMRLTLHHTKAFLRFAFKVADSYDKIRFVKVTSISLNGNSCFVADKVLSTGNTPISYAYIDPSVVTTSSENTLACTYNIYDKDAKFDDSMSSDELKKHLTREGVTAQNTFRLNNIKKDPDSDPISKLEAGYYYDLNVILNPDYLYVLSEHDNKQHITIQ